jgi:hypothetical protein
MLGLGTRALALGAAAIALGVDAVYLVAIGLEDGGDAGTQVGLVAASLAAAGVLAAAGAFAPGGSGPLVLLTASATVLVFWGVLGLASIGIPLLVGALLAASAATRAAEQAPPGAFRLAIGSVVGVAAALVVAVALS